MTASDDDVDSVVEGTSSNPIAVDDGRKKKTARKSHGVVSEVPPPKKAKIAKKAKTWKIEASRTSAARCGKCRSGCGETIQKGEPRFKRTGVCQDQGWFHVKCAPIKVAKEMLENYGGSIKHMEGRGAEDLQIKPLNKMLKAITAGKEV